MGESLSKEELEQMLTLVDTNKDGKIDYDGMIEIFNF
jgi:Ca2+-binding EF-hand superfamily protein